MKRYRQQDLEDWSRALGRKPLVVRGARQVGKSFLVRSWGAQRYTRVAEANLERRPELGDCFVDNDPRATLRRLEVALGQVIVADGSTLLFLDEIQAAPQTLARLRWFAEELPALPIVAAGSLLDFALRSPDVATPVGRISFLHLEPMGFGEFCLALGEDPLVAWLQELTAQRIAKGRSIPEEMHAKAAGLFRAWLLVGGMPAVVEAYRAERSALAAAAVQRDLMATLRDDFAKYAGRVPHARLRSVLDSVPQQLGRKFTYRHVDPDERAADLKRAVDLLCLARVCHRVRATPARGLPLGAGAKDAAFKLLSLDVGLVSAALRVDLAAMERTPELALVHRGALAEQAVGQLLRVTFESNDEPALYWWRRERRGAEAELDYVHAVGGRLIPIEVKSGKAGTLKSLHGFVAERGLPLALRVHSRPPEVQDVEAETPLGRASYRLLSLPPYLVEQAPGLIERL